VFFNNLAITLNIGRSLYYWI